MVKVKFHKEFRVASPFFHEGILVFPVGEQEVEEWVAKHHAAKSCMDILDQKFKKLHDDSYVIEPPNPLEVAGNVIDDLGTVSIESIDISKDVAIEGTGIVQ